MEGPRYGYSSITWGHRFPGDRTFTVPRWKFQVVDRRAQQIRSILELAKSCIAVETEESTNVTTLVIMIDMDGWRVATNGAHAIL